MPLRNLVIIARRLSSYTLLAVAVCAVYFNALWADFQFDDYKVIVDNPRVHAWQAWLDDLGHGIRPALKFTYTLNWISGWGVAGFHVTNIMIHLCNVFMVFALARQFVRSHPQLPENPFGVPFFTALLFALHPIHTEAVTYICGRSIALMTLFYLAGLLAYIYGCAHNSKIHLLAVTPLCFVAALGVKEAAVTFPLALLAWELACGGTLKIAFRRQWPCWAALMLAGVFFLWSGSYLSEMERSAGLNSLRGNMATQAIAFAYLLRQWMFPFWLNIDPDLKVVHGFTGQMPYLFLFAAVFVLALFTIRRRPWIGFGLAWALIQLAPLYIFLPRLDVANDRQMYLASWPLAIAFTSEMAIWLRQKTFVLAGAAWALVFGGLTVTRNQAYQNEVSLWEDTVIQSPDKARAHNNLGYAYMLAGRNSEARREFEIALKIAPDYYKARNNLLRLESDAP